MTTAYAAPLRWNLLALLASAALLLVASGCVTGYPGPGYFQTRPEVRYPDAAALANPPFPPRGLPMFDGHGGRILLWSDLMDGVQWADVVILGEQHDDAVGHAVQLAVVQNAFASDSHAAVSMEMLERNEQPIVDEYLAGLIDAETFTERTGSRSWGGEQGWFSWYLPIIDEAKRWDAPVIAANAPRRFVRMARLEGWSALRALPPEDQRDFSLPRRASNGGAEFRFAEFMRASWAQHTATEDGPGKEPSPEEIAAAWRSQSLWDATMAESIVEALGPPWNRRRVIHLVGQFHSDFDGGLVQQVRGRDATARILTVSLRPSRALSLQPEDVGRADVVIYTGWTGTDG